MSAGLSDLRVAWDLFKRYWVAFLLAQLVLVAAWLVLEVAVLAAQRSGIPTLVGWVVWLLLHLAFLWVYCGLMAGIHAMALQAVDGGAPTFATARTRFDRAPGYLAASLLYWAAVLVGLGLAVVPGILVAVRWGLFRFIVAGKSRSALSSLHAAAALSTARRWQLSRVLVLAAVLNLAGAALLGLGLLVAFPVSVLLRARAFRTLQQQIVLPRGNAELFPATATPGT